MPKSSLSTLDPKKARKLQKAPRKTRDHEHQEITKLYKIESFEHNRKKPRWSFVFIDFLLHEDETKGCA